VVFQGMRRLAPDPTVYPRDFVPSCELEIAWMLKAPRAQTVAALRATATRRPRGVMLRLERIHDEVGLPRVDGARGNSHCRLHVGKSFQCRRYLRSRWSTGSNRVSERA
jgi:hypothetical protein